MLQASWLLEQAACCRALQCIVCGSEHLWCLHAAESIATAWCKLSFLHVSGQYAADCHKWDLVLHVTRTSMTISHMQDIMGKIFGIFFPVAAFVSISFSHVVRPPALLAG